MKTYYKEVKAWLDGPDDGRVPSEALVGLVQEHEHALDALRRLSSMKAFCAPRAVRIADDEELIARIEFAQKWINSLDPK